MAPTRCAAHPRPTNTNKPTAGLFSCPLPSSNGILLQPQPLNPMPCSHCPAMPVASLAACAWNRADRLPCCRLDERIGGGAAVWRSHKVRGAPEAHQHQGALCWVLLLPSAFIPWKLPSTPTPQLKSLQPLSCHAQCCMCMHELGKPSVLLQA